jgi:phosphate-selective porin OprO/OprP
VAVRALYRPTLFVAVLLLAAGATLVEGSEASATAPAAPPAPADSHPAATTGDDPGVAPEPPAPPAAGPDYLLPDVPPAKLVWENDRFWFKPVFAVVTDYTFFDQDAASLEQVGLQDDTGELRAGRVGGTLRSKGEFTWDFYATVDYQEKATRDDTVFDVYDLKIGIPIGPVKLDIGKMKEPICYELSGLSVLLPHQERILLPFYPTRSIGVKLSGYLAGDRVTWAAGAYNDWLDSNVGEGREGIDYVGRMTALVWESPSKHDYLHLGLGFRQGGSDDGVMRFSGRPESNVADKYVDTGNFPADHADELSYELLVARGPVALLAERFDARVDSPETGDPRFSGWYVGGSWTLTGEHRPYNRAQAYAAGPIPTRRLGAVEMVAKYSHLDITDGTLDGGLLDKWYFGLNWWLSKQWKLGIGYGDGDLDKDGLVGNTKMLLFRLQWLY